MTEHDESTPTFGEDPAVQEGSATNPLDALRKETKRDVRLPVVDLSVPVRPGWGMRFDPNAVDADKMKVWAKKATPGNNRRARRSGEVDITDADQIKFARMVLQATHRAFLWQEHEGAEWQVVILDEESGKPLSLADDEFHDMVGAVTTDEALRLWYGSDGHLLQVAEEVIFEAGFSEGDVNPLKAQ